MKNLFLGLLVGSLLMGCGGGKGVVSDVKFDSSLINGEQYLGLDATLASGGLVLPAMTLPLINPRNPSETLGEIETNGQHIIARVNASRALNLPSMADGTRLPNGAAIPLILPAGLNPVAIPAFNSNSLVYIAVRGKQIMLGVAVTLLKQDTLKLPLNIFLPFTISPEIHGTGGFFLGDKQGVAVFALRESIAAPAMAPASRISLAGTADVGRIEVDQEPVTYSKIRRLQKTWSGLGDVQID